MLTDGIPILIASTSQYSRWQLKSTCFHDIEVIKNETFDKNGKSYKTNPLRFAVRLVC